MSQKPSARVSPLRFIMPWRVPRHVCCATLMLGCTIVRPPLPTTPASSARRDGLPVVTTPEIKTTLAPQPQLSLLPAELQGGRFAISNLNVQRVSIELKPRTAAVQSPQEVFDQVISPFLKAVSFARGPAAFRIPGEPVAEPAADLEGAAQLLDDQYRNVPRRMRRGTEEMISAAQGSPSESADSKLWFLSGTNVAQFRADFEQVELSYPFAQVVDDVPIEHTALIATGRRGESVSQVTGTLLHDYQVTNARPVPDGDPRPLVQRALQELDPALAARPGEAAPVLVALPYGNVPSGGVALRYAWRTGVEMDVSRQPASFLAWVDAQTGKLLKLEPLTAYVEANGNTWRRDPGTPTVRRKLQIDPATDGHYHLSLDQVSARVEYRGSAGSGNVRVPENGQSPVNLDQPPHDVPAQACKANAVFQQISFFAWLQSSHQQAVANGVYTPFPDTPWKPVIEGDSCQASSELFFGVCSGHFKAGCPQPQSTDPDEEENYLSYAQDGSVVAHEVGHVAVQRLAQNRPDDWCRGPSCPKPVGWGALHDLADAWAAHLQDTNCVGGWVAKNVGGVDARKECIGDDRDAPQEGRHAEDSSLPRRHELNLVLDPTKARDHFPERVQEQRHDPYANMQVGAAVLWQLREGLASRLPAFGVLRYFRRLLAALRATGMATSAPPATDAGLYSYLYELEWELMKRWAPAGRIGDSMSNEVLAAFARGGLFVLPPECLDGDLNTKVTSLCPDGEGGADAVVDIDDNSLEDDLVIEAVRHPDNDFLQLGGPAPTFHVWTGARFKFNTDGVAQLGAPPCNVEFRVEASTDPRFATGQATVDSDWIRVNAEAKTCQGAWTPNEADWVELQARGDGSKIYYRAETRDAAGGNLRRSTAPGNGHWNVAAPFALLTETGVPDL